MAFKGENVGDWTLDRKLGKGLHGETWRARGPEDTSAAVRLHSGPRSIRAVRAGGRPPTAESPHLPDLLEFDAKANVPRIVWAFHEGESLRELLDERDYLPVGASLVVFLQVLKGVRALHEAGHAHWNLRPENVLVDAEERVVITDPHAPGLHEALVPRVLEGEGKRAAAFEAARPYLSPEQRESRSRWDGWAADAWSLGVLLYEMTTGRLPPEPAVELRYPTRSDHRIPTVVNEICLRNLDRQPRARQTDLAELERTLTLGLGKDGFVVDPTGPPTTWIRRLAGGDEPVAGDETRSFASFLKKFIPERLRSDA